MNTNGEVRHPRVMMLQDEHGRLVYVDEHDQQHADVEAVRAFPITDPEHGISILTKEGKELAWIDDLAAVPNPARRLLEDILQQKQFMPIIRRVLRISPWVEPNEWEVETDRGPTRFPMKSEEDVRRLAGHRALIIDAHGVRYLIPDLQALDAGSRRFLEGYL
jgi:hypothetical protein